MIWDLLPPGATLFRESSETILAGVRAVDVDGIPECQEVHAYSFVRLFEEV